LYYLSASNFSFFLFFIFFFMFFLGINQSYPNAQGAASSAGTNPNGILNLANQAQASYSSQNGFQATSNTQNSAQGPWASIQSSAAASASTGNTADINWNVIANGNAFSTGNALTGTLQNLDQGSASFTSQVIGQGQSQITGNGTGLQLSSTANANANAQLASKQLKVPMKSVSPPAKAQVSIAPRVLATQRKVVQPVAVKTQLVQQQFLNVRVKQARNLA
jgi:hypothetical protein